MHIASEKKAAFAARLAGERCDATLRERYIRRLSEDGGRPAESKIKTPPRGGKERRLRDGERCHPSVCFSCHSTCEVLVYTDEKTGRILRVEGDPDSPQTNGRLCAKGLAAADLCYNPQRLKKPLRRVGPKGSGKFVEISWDEALDEIAQKLLAYRETHGPQSVAMLEGTRRGWSRVYSRLANSFGTPNHGAAGWAQCLWPRLIDCNLTYGKGAQYSESQDFDKADLILCWGVNPPTCWGVKAGDIMHARQQGAVLIVVDPFLSEIAAKADLWLQVRPGSDTALALSMLHVIIEEELYDQEFVAEWTNGFDALQAHVRPFTADWGSEVTGVSPKLIRRAARLYAGANAASVFRCLALDQQHDSVQCCRAVSLLISVTGNVGRPGGNVVSSGRGEISQNTHAFIRADAVPPETAKLRCGYDAFPLLTQELSPVPTAHMPTLWEQVLSGEPYPIPCAVIFGSNAKVIYTNADRVEEALSKLEFLAVCDLFLTPTAKMADIVLPASSWLERDNLISSFQSDATHTLFQQKLEQIGESKNDVDIIIALAERLGISEHFWADSEALYDALAAPTGRTFREGLRERRLYAPLQYETYKSGGFQTPSGKIELYSTLAKEKGCAPLPPYTPSFQSPVDTPELAETYPLILTTGRHETAFRHTENRRNPHLLNLAPRATLDIHPDTAKALGIAEGRKVLVESTAGRAYAYARFTRGLRRDVVQGIAGWEGAYNINKTVPWGQYAEGVGTVCARGYLCRVSPVEE